MSRSLITALGAAALLGAFSTLALAGQPDPLTCTWDDLVGVSPKNLTVGQPFRYIFDGNVRDSGGVPIADFPAEQLELDFTFCTNPSSRPADQIVADANTDIDGRAVWTVNLAFGGGDPCSVRVLVQNVVYKTLARHQSLSNENPESPILIDGGMRSPDENGDTFVSAQDLSLFQQEFARPNGQVRLDWRGDLGPVFNGTCSAQDLSTFQQHFVP